MLQYIAEEHVKMVNEWEKHRCDMITCQLIGHNLAYTVMIEFKNRLHINRPSYLSLG